MTLPLDLGTLISRSMLMLEPQMELPQEDLKDALGELVNLIAGNLKAHIFEENSLSIPRISFDSHYHSQMPKSEVICRTYLQTEGNYILEATLLRSRPGE